MIKQFFATTVSALCYSLIDYRFKSSAIPQHFPNNSVVNFVIQQQNRMPDYLQFPLFILTLIFDIWGLLGTGLFFHSQSPSMRQLQIESWKNSPLQICRDLIRFYESLVVLYWQSDYIN
ncbi:MAG TPA: hypothetical protein DCQ51_06635 [Planktothrix sp. UBA8407]|jgi:hypothetical protein|nr:hypothetical protein [Planktothrix sp. UBA8407]HBK21853.1 hypothetical protein [Planktothrix sp. UBA10369]